MTHLPARPRRSRLQLRRGLAVASATALVAGLTLSANTVADAQRPTTPATPSPSSTTKPAPVIARTPAQRAQVAELTAHKASKAEAAARVASSDRGVIANLFEWNWTSIGTECTDVLGPAGYGGVQVAPPQDSIKRTALGNGSDTILHPWWEVYQPVDYNLTSRMGTELQFQQMVKACRAAGVKVYVDAVINHMTGQGDTSYGGVSFQRRNYPGVYNETDFHTYTNACPSASGGIEDYNNLQQVRNCDLVGLADLDTGKAKVQNTIAAYLNKLIGYGVSGFRVDAAKHIGQPDLDAIYAKLRKTKDGEKPYWALEVFGGGPGLLSPMAFTSSGSVLGLDADVQIKNAFKSYPTNATGSIATLKVFGADSGLPPSDKTLTFVQNHDTERNGDALSYKDGAKNILANEFLLASGYGTPQVYASFAWNVVDDSPPADSNGLVTDTNCSDTATWVCVDRNPGVLSMVGWANYVGKARQANWYDDGANLIAFSRGAKGWVALNNGTAAKSVTVQTGLAAGRYCDLISGVKTHTRCTGNVVTVKANGKATVNVPAQSAIAIDKRDRI